MACAAPALATLAPPAAIRWRAWTEAAHADYEANLVPTPVEPLDMAEVVRAIDRHVPADTIFTNGAGNFSGWLHRFHRYAGLRHAGRTPARADVGRDGLRPAGRGRRGAARAAIAPSSTSPATATS